jgi:hypothetical protein
VTGGKPIASSSQSVAGVSAVYHLIAIYDINERKGGVLFFCSAEF